LAIFFHAKVSHGLTLKWIPNELYDPSFNIDIRHPVKRNVGGRARMFVHFRLAQNQVMHQFNTMFSSNQGWESISKRSYSTNDHILIESWLLGKAFDKFVEHYSMVAQSPLDISFHSQMFSSATQYFAGGIPDLSDLFGKHAPIQSMVYQSTCHLQSHWNTDMSICFDTGCSMSSTFSLDDFERPPMKGNFGQLRTITHVVPIVAAGLICWQVYDKKGEKVFIRVPGYYIPSSRQQLFSPQNYARYHNWWKPELDCYGGNDKHFWMKIALANKGECSKIQMEISVLDGLPYMQAIPIDQSPMAQCSSCVQSECQSCQQAFHLNVLSEQNENLSSVQKALLLDHQ